LQAPLKSQDGSGIISTPDEAIELLQGAYDQQNACRQLKTSATEKVRQARLEEEHAERKLYEAEGYATKIIDLIKEKGFQLSSIVPDFFLLINGSKCAAFYSSPLLKCPRLKPLPGTHSIIAAGNSTSVNITLD
jgi:hypothetical protein